MTEIRCSLTVSHCSFTRRVCLSADKKCKRLRLD